MKNINKIISHSQLSILRVLLSMLAGKATLHHIDIIFEFKKYSPDITYLSWFLELLPERLVNLNAESEHSLKLLVVFLVIGASVGLFGRFCLLLLSLVMFFVFGFNSAYGVFDHHNSLSSQVIFILAFIPGTMTISIDTIIWRWFKNQKKDQKQISTQPNANWGFTLILIVLSLTYFTSGLSKLRYGGLAWMDGNTLSFYLSDTKHVSADGFTQMMIGSDVDETNKWKDDFGIYAHIYGNQHSGILAAIGQWLSERRILIAIVSSIVLIFELLSPLLLINNRWRTYYLLGAIIMHTSIGMLMGLAFTQYRLVCFCLMDWSFVTASIRKVLPATVEIQLAKLLKLQ